MGIDFITSKDIPFNELGPRLAKYGIKAHPMESGQVFLSDGETLYGECITGVTAWPGTDGMLSSLTKGYGPIWGMIREEFDTQIAVLTGYPITHDVAGEPWKG
jgi:hypothetical protein